MQKFITSYFGARRQALPQTALARSKGSVHERSAALRKHQGLEKYRGGNLKWIALMSSLAHLIVVKGFILASKPFAVSKHIIITIFFSACALSAMNLMNACSLLFPRNPWITNFFTCWRHSTGQASCQKLRLTFPVGLLTFTDCK